MYVHKPVMVNKVLEYLDIRTSDTVVDCTLGEGGHSSYILERLGSGRIIGIEQDEQLLNISVKRFEKFGVKFLPIKGNFFDIKKIINEKVGKKVEKIFFDLGVSMYHFKKSRRGFSFYQDEPLDMRLDISKTINAKDVINNFDKKKLSQIIWAYGEERFANRISDFIIKEREKNPITTSSQLADIVKRAIPRKFWPRKIHPATKTFQAIRYYVNDEIEILEKSIRDAIDVLKPEGRICVISFNSLEDRIVKTIFKELSKGCTCPPDFPVCVCGGKKLLKIIMKKPVAPDKEEIERNSASRSAKMRCAIKLDNGVIKKINHKLPDIA